MSGDERGTPLILWPFVAIWRLTTLVFQVTARLVAIALGLALILIGAVISLTVIGAVVGIPLMGFGFLLVVRGLF